MQVALGTDGLDGELPAAVEVVTYRVVAEALTNVAKHAHARSAAVTVRRDARHLEVRVSDDGVGFGGADPGPGTGVGLTSIRSRADELGGRCAIRSGMSGTTVELLLPCSLSCSGRRGRPRRRRELAQVRHRPERMVRRRALRRAQRGVGQQRTQRGGAQRDTMCGPVHPCSTAATPATIADAALVPPKPSCSPPPPR